VSLAGEILKRIFGLLF